MEDSLFVCTSLPHMLAYRHTQSSVPRDDQHADHAYFDPFLWMPRARPLTNMRRKYIDMYVMTCMQRGTSSLPGPSSQLDGVEKSRA